MHLDRMLCMLDSKKQINNRLVVANKDRIKDKGSMLSSINRLSIHCNWKSDHSTSCGNQSIPPRVENKLSTLCGQKLSFPPCVGIIFCFTKSNNNPKPKKMSKKSDCKTLLTNTITSQRHLSSNIKNNLMHDMETNPGLGEKLKIITMNCRGLGEIEKFRLLLNKAYDIMQKGKMVMMMQETMITNSRYLDLAWRGKNVYTPGTGNSQGCITLTHNDVTITDIEPIQNRRHYFKLTDADNKQTLIANIYAPLGYNNEKNKSFRNIMNIIANYAGEKIILGGEFNITVTNSESLRRQRTEAEKRIADDINIKINENYIADAWDGHIGYTWKRGKTQSRLDKIYTRISQYTNKKLETNWTLTKSDNAAVILALEHKEKINTKSEHIKLGNTIATNTELLNELKQYLEEKMIQAIDMNPHMKLEFAKMAIRT